MNPLITLAASALFALPLSNDLDANRYAVRARAQAKLERLPVESSLGVVLIGGRSAECRQQAERWLAAKKLSPAPAEYGTVLYGPLSKALDVFNAEPQRFIDLFRLNGLLNEGEWFWCERGYYGPNNNVDGLLEIRARVGTYDSPTIGDN